MKNLQGYLKSRTAFIFLCSYIIIMILPMCVGLVYYYPTTREMLIDRASERSVSAMDQLTLLMDAQLNNVMNMPSYIVGNQQIIEYDILHIYKVVDEKMASWVVNNNVDEEWDSYIAQLESMGLNEMREIYQAAYDSYLSG